MAKHLTKGQRSAVLAALCIVGILAIAAPTMAYDVPCPPNARLMGMGWTWVGVADHPDAACSNPAAYGFNEGEGSLTLGAGFGESLRNSDLLYVGICDKDRGMGAGGLAFLYRKIGDGEQAGELGYATYRVGKRVYDWLSLGAGVCSFRMGDESLNLVTTDVGAMLKLGYLYAGVQAAGLSKSMFGVDWSMNTQFSPEFSVGLALKPSKSFIMAVDVHGLAIQDGVIQPWYSGGAELWLADRLALRGGAIMVTNDRDRIMSYTGGAGLKVKKGEIGYSIMWNRDGELAQCFTASASF